MHAMIVSGCSNYLKKKSRISLMHSLGKTQVFVLSVTLLTLH